MCHVNQVIKENVWFNYEMKINLNSGPPVNSIWDEWSDYGSCSASCGDSVTKTRKRVCLEATNGGSYLECAQDAVEEEHLPCFVPECVQGMKPFFQF